MSQIDRRCDSHDNSEAVFCLRDDQGWPEGPEALATTHDWGKDIGQRTSVSSRRGLKCHNSMRLMQVLSGTGESRAPSTRGGRAMAWDCVSPWWNPRLCCRNRTWKLEGICFDVAI